MIGNKDYPADEWPWLCDALFFLEQRPLAGYRCHRRWRVVAGKRRYCDWHARFQREKPSSVTSVRLTRLSGLNQK